MAKCPQGPTGVKISYYDCLNSNHVSLVYNLLIECQLGYAPGVMLSIAVHVEEVLILLSTSSIVVFFS